MEKSFLILSEERLEDLTQKMNKIIDLIENSNGQITTDTIGNKWITEKKAQELTGKKTTTLWKMRNSGQLTFTKINNRVYYDQESILAILERNKREAFQ